VLPSPAVVHAAFRGASGRVSDVREDRLAGLADQLGWLVASGFAAVDWRFKWLELALIAAQIARSSSSAFSSSGG
jgi:hypothetical protein